jgi:hypothetical protein
MTGGLRAQYMAPRTSQAKLSGEDAAVSWRKGRASTKTPLALTVAAAFHNWRESNPRHLEFKSYSTTAAVRHAVEPAPTTTNGLFCLQENLAARLQRRRRFGGSICCITATKVPGPLDRLTHITADL